MLTIQYLLMSEKTPSFSTAATPERFTPRQVAEAAISLELSGMTDDEVFAERDTSTERYDAMRKRFEDLEAREDAFLAKITKKALQLPKPAEAYYPPGQKPLTAAEEFFALSEGQRILGIVRSGEYPWPDLSPIIETLDPEDLENAKSLIEEGQTIGEEKDLMVEREHMIGLEETKRRSRTEQ